MTLFDMDPRTQDTKPRHLEMGTRLYEARELRDLAERKAREHATDRGTSPRAIRWTVCVQKEAAFLLVTYRREDSKEATGMLTVDL